MKLPPEVVAEYFTIKDDLSSDERAIVQATVLDCAQFVAELHMNMPTTDYQSGINEGYRIASYALLQRYGIEP